MNKYVKPSRNDQIWIDQKEKLLLRYSDLSDTDLYFEAGRKREMIERLGVKLGKSDAEMYLIFKSLN
ncbi:MAG: hypothetical protein EHM93_12765 [Bacteroidales bacterium]|nr:MAG: hypothetical protein EHM93_12765 [Bacteroidales bacterium]